jgi:uncharacterized RDD family membrane protein YckC
MTGTARREYAGFVSRAMAYLTDAGIVTVLALGGLIVVEVVGVVVGGSARDAIREFPLFVLAAMPAVLAFYCAFFWGLAGRTPGMTLLGVRVVTTAGGAVSWPAAAIRALVLAYFPIGALWSLVDRRRQAVHDKLARTAVVRAVPAGDEPASSPAGVPTHPQ